MQYAPHYLYKGERSVVRNEYGEIAESTDKWVYVGVCRCDDNTTQHFETENGEIYTPQYKIVCEKCAISEGDRVKVLDKDNKTYRGGGKVFNCPKCNYLNYMTIYV